MKKLPLLLVLAASLPAQADPAADPAADVAALAAASVARDLSATDAAARIAAIRLAAGHDDPRVAVAIGRGLRDPTPSVQLAAITALRHMTNAAALTQLLRAERLFEKSHALGPAYYLALGQSGRPAALAVLTRRAWNPVSLAIFEARVMAIAHIRSPKSIAALFELHTKYRPARTRGTGFVIGPYRRALARGMEVLTGSKAPRAPEAWRRWWHVVKNTKRVVQVPAGLAGKELIAWRRMWERPAAAKRAAAKRAAAKRAAAKRAAAKRAAAKRGRKRARRRRR